MMVVCQVASAQAGSFNLKNIFHQNATLDEQHLAELQRGDPVVTRLPPQQEKEVAVYGLVRVQAPPEVFLQSFLETIATKSNPAILEIGRFASMPALEDLKTLTLEARDIEDVKKCVVGNCALKLSAKMIEQFQKTVDWQSTDYADQAIRAYKSMLLDYVQDYLKRGDRALIEYSDKSTTVSLRDGQRMLLESLPTFFREARQTEDSMSRQRLVPIENTIVWSKIKFGLKPVLAINHIVIFKNEHGLGPQILVLSKQIYANHYFNASIALTGLARNPAGNDEYYLFYENHSIADGLQGLFSGIKRRLIEKQAVDGLTAIMRQTKVRLDARALYESESGPAPKASSGFYGLRIPRKQLLFLLICVSALFMLALNSYQRKANVPPRRPI